MKRINDVFCLPESFHLSALAFLHHPPPPPPGILSAPPFTPLQELTYPSPDNHSPQLSPCGCVNTVFDTLLFRKNLQTDHRLRDERKARGGAVLRVDKEDADTRLRQQEPSIILRGGGAIKTPCSDMSALRRSRSVGGRSFESLLTLQGARGKGVFPLRQGRSRARSSRTNKGQTYPLTLR